ncbi:hypothetical protein TCON_1828 [Astathelohania contejeani]|uniref:Uncharacterized protein n=1 Tax=Astathelohania contejeani TaxID=164912 RepID=A0ABQ7HXQ0_9MICR|nr:hypothetical protein TCON_1828 [Thelohania contejeani]
MNIFYLFISYIIFIISEDVSDICNEIVAADENKILDCAIYDKAIAIFQENKSKLNVGDERIDLIILKQVQNCRNGIYGDNIFYIQKIFEFIYHYTLCISKRISDDLLNILIFDCNYIENTVSYNCTTCLIQLANDNIFPSNKEIVDSVINNIFLFKYNDKIKSILISIENNYINKRNSNMKQKNNKIQYNTEIFILSSLAEDIAEFSDMLNLNITYITLFDLYNILKLKIIILKINIQRRISDHQQLYSEILFIINYLIFFPLYDNQNEFFKAVGEILIEFFVITNIFNTIFQNDFESEAIPLVNENPISSLVLTIDKAKKVTFSIIFRILSTDYRGKTIANCINIKNIKEINNLLDDIIHEMDTQNNCDISKYNTETILLLLTSYDLTKLEKYHLIFLEIINKLHYILRKKEFIFIIYFYMIIKSLSDKYLLIKDAEIRNTMRNLYM